MSDMKYEMIESEVPGLYRIKALKDFGSVKKGDLGGYVERETNLSQEGLCWIGDNAIVKDFARVRDEAYVYENAKVQDNAEVSGNVEVYGHALIGGESLVTDFASVGGNAKVLDEAIIKNNAYVSGNAKVRDHVIIKDSALVSDYAKIHGKAVISNYAEVSGNAEVYGNAQVSGHAAILDYVQIFEQAFITDRARVEDYGVIGGNAQISDYAQIKGQAYVHGNARVYHHQVVKYGRLNKDVFKTKDWKQAVYNLYGIVPVNNKVVLYKRVNEFSDGTLRAIYNPSFKYPHAGLVKDHQNIDFEDIKEACRPGLHFADPLYWFEGDVLLCAEIDLKDIVTIQEGKVVVTQATILEAIPASDYLED